MGVIKNIADYFAVSPGCFVPFVGGMYHGELVTQRAQEQGDFFPAYRHYVANAFINTFDLSTGIGLFVSLGKLGEYSGFFDFVASFDVSTFARSLDGLIDPLLFN